MKSIGIVRKLDQLGRVVVPVELRRVLKLAEKDAIEIFVEDDKIILKKYQPNMACAITGEISKENVSLLDGLVLSKQGARLLYKQLESVNR